MSYNAHWNLAGDDSDGGKVRKGFATGEAAWDFLDSIPNLAKAAVFDDHSRLPFHRPVSGVAPQGLVVYLREVDATTPNACWVVCCKGDPGAVAFAPLEAVT